MKTYRDVLKESLETFKTEKIDFTNPITGEHIVQESHECLPITLGEFISSMGAILCGIAEMLLMDDVPSIYYAGEQIDNGKAVKNPDAFHVIRVLSGIDLGRGMILSIQLQNFIEWLLNQEIPEDSIMWNDFHTLSDKWNELAKIQRDCQ